MITDWLKNILFPAKKSISPQDTQQIKEGWEKVEKLIKERKEHNYRLAVVEADKLFGLALEKLGYREDTWAKSMARAQSRFSGSVREGIWQAHKVRNRVAHDVNHEFNSMESRAAVSKFRRGLKELGVL